MADEANPTPKKIYAVRGGITLAATGVHGFGCLVEAESEEAARVWLTQFLSNFVLQIKKFVLPLAHDPERRVRALQQAQSLGLGDALNIESVRPLEDVEAEAVAVLAQEQAEAGGSVV